MAIQTRCGGVSRDRCVQRLNSWLAGKACCPGELVFEKRLLPLWAARALLSLAWRHVLNHCVLLHLPSGVLGPVSCLRSWGQPMTAAPCCAALPMQPDPRQQPVSSIYNFHTWSRQLRAFTREVVGGGPVTLTCNSVGGIAGLQVGRGRSASGWKHAGNTAQGAAGGRKAGAHGEERAAGRRLS